MDVVCFFVFTFQAKISDKYDPGLMRAATMDGLTLGHYCCGVKNCHGELKGNRDHFCPKHASQAKICVVVGCNVSKLL